MPRLIMMLFFLTFSAFSVAADEESYGGIWQDKDRSSDYYVIEEKGDSLVLIALPGIEASGNTLRFTFIGNRNDLLVSRVLSDESPNDIYQQLQLKFISSGEGYFFPVCDVCSVVGVNIVKVF